MTTGTAATYGNYPTNAERLAKIKRRYDAARGLDTAEMSVTLNRYRHDIGDLLGIIDALKEG
jgi:hypothetical protein